MVQFIQATSKSESISDETIESDLRTLLGYRRVTVLQKQKSSASSTATSRDDIPNFNYVISVYAVDSNNQFVSHQTFIEYLIYTTFIQFFIKLILQIIFQ